MENFNDQGVITYNLNLSKKRTKIGDSIKVTNFPNCTKVYGVKS